jgi:hypothetical protein
MAILKLDLSDLQDFPYLLDKAPKILFKHLAKAFKQIGRLDIDNIRQNVSGSLNLRSKGAANSFKFKSTDEAKATDFTKLFTSEYTGWKAAEIFQTGGTIRGKTGELTVLTAEGKKLLKSLGKQPKMNIRQTLQSLMATGEVRFIPSPVGTLLVKEKDLLTKTGRIRHDRHPIILGVLKKSITEKKRINFYETSEGAESIHQELLEYAIEDTLVELETMD